MEIQAEELRRSNAELEQFAYIASHDLQEPLRKVASFCQMLGRRYSGQLDERADQYIAFAVDGAKRMQSLINDLLAFSRVGRTTAGFRPVDLNACVATAESDLETLLAETEANIEVGDLPEVPGDASLLRQLFLNLIGNAVKFRGSEAPRVRITAERDGDFWAITAADNGIGIDPRYAEKVFAIFTRLHPRDQYEGTGIGLALCRKIVEFHGGTIDVVLDPPPGVSLGGATLRFTLPVTAAPIAGDACCPSARHHCRSTAGNRRFPHPQNGRVMTTPEPRLIEVLLVEDDPGDVLLTREAFEHQKVANRLHIVNNGEDAISFLRKQGQYTDAPDPDLVLLDLNLPGMHGREVLAAVKEDPKLQTIPVVVLTTSEAEEDVLRSYQLHANAYVTKPVDFDRFMAVVRAIDEFFVSVVRLPAR